ncbi:MAG: serine hydrolase [Bacteroidales bacterium]|nr:serine hydrolase [Bacteroidales bacterium]
MEAFQIEFDGTGHIYYCMHPEKVGMNAEVLNKIDDIAIKGLKAEAYPGCQSVALRNGEKVYEKAFGTYTYNDSVYVTNASVYDLASLTKSLATTLAVMKLYDEGKLSLTDHASKYVHELKHTNKSKITIAQLLTHTSGLPAWIPFYKSTLKNGMPDPDIYDTLPSEHYPEQVAEHLYIHKNYGEKMLKEIAHAKLNPSQGYVYSDLGFYILKEIVEHISKTTLDEYVRTAFYEPMQLHSTGFCPLRRLDTGLVVPTENDTYFRHQLLRGHVHDMGAAMMGGVSGHAGLFSTASEAAELIQMLLNKGTYNGKTYLKPETVTLFTNYYQSNRRGLGFDKPYANKKSGHVCHQAGKNSFGHSGYTGTYFWADFDTGIVYVFLSNRVHPTAENTKLAKLNIRTDIHELLYKAIIK